ncbi:MAG: hypothetical protein ABR956_01555, partial [Terracidiphilus sp.]
MNLSAQPPVASRSGFLPAALRVALFAVLAVFFLSSALLYAKDSASSLYKRGVAAEAREDFDTAFTDYQKACAKEPKNMYYRAAFYR